jgi:hypothetical protein
LDAHDLKLYARAQKGRFFLEPGSYFLSRKEKIAPVKELETLIESFDLQTELVVDR